MKQNITHLSGYLKTFAVAMVFALASINGHTQSITLLSPNGGEAWLVNSYEEVSWTGQELGATMRLELSPDGGVSWSYIGDVPSAPDGGIFPVFVPSFPSINALLRITDFSNPAVSDVSDAPFTVSFPPFTIWEPSSGSAIFNNSPAFINWTIYEPGVSLFNAEISTDNGVTFTPFAQNINAWLGYTYLVLGETPAEACVLKLYNAENPATFALSGVFQIRPAPVYTITSPAQGQIVNANSLLTINWSVQNLYEQSNFIEFSPDNGETWEFIAEGNSLGNSGSVQWYTPNITSDECLIRISDYYSLSSVAVSNAFTIMPFPETPVCIVTVDSLTNQNVIVWEKPASDLISDFLVYKETDEFNVYEVIDTVNYQDLPVVTDFDSNPAIRPYRYKIGFRDNENRVFPAGDYHQTIHLTINQGVGGRWNLIWTPYTGFAYNSYKIMRKAGDGPFEQIATVSASFTSYTDFNAPSGDISYMIQITNQGGCSVELRNTVYADVFSNQASNFFVSSDIKQHAGFSLYPVPARDRLNIQLGDEIKGRATLAITDLAGRVIHSEEFSGIQPGGLLIVDISAYNQGIYLVNMTSSGNNLTAKFVISN